MGHEAGGDAIYTFGPFRLDAREHKFTKEGKEVDLAMTPRQLLFALVKRHEELVSKEDLIKEVWGSRAVSDDSFYQHISVLRKTLGGGRDKYIINFPWKGYKFVAPVEVDRRANEVPARQPKPDIIRILPPGDSGYRTVVLGSDEDHVVDGSGKVVRPGDRVIENVEHIDGSFTREQTGTVVLARDGSNELLFQDLAGQIAGVLKMDRAGNIFIDHSLGWIVEEGSSNIPNPFENGSDNIPNPFENGSDNIINPPEAGTGAIAPKQLKRSGPRRKRSGAS
jgi:DNA-binding winged helix-turn-helix (wHTH) protein